MDMNKVYGAMGITKADWDGLPESVKAGALKLHGQNEVLAQAVSGNGKFSLHLGDKGTVVIRGFGRFPHSFYVEQLDAFTAWIRGEGFKTIQAFTAANKDKLKTKVASVVENQAAAS